MKDIELQISQFIDQELSDTEQRELFTVLSEDEKARRVLSDFMQIKKNTSDHYSNITTNLSQVQIPQPQIKNLQESSSKYRTMFYFSLAASIVLALLLVWSQSDRNKTENLYSALYTKYIGLQKQYSLFSQAKREDVLQNEKQFQISSRQSITRNKSSESEKAKFPIASLSTGRKSERLNKLLDDMLTAKITKDDFLTPQMIGN
ncbi:MAG: hypothetical protein FIA82_14030 [Melioribacter sp.]|nr:hypothetical protein [Melioribacter sp.]